VDLKQVKQVKQQVKTIKMERRIDDVVVFNIINSEMARQELVNTIRLLIQEELFSVEFITSHLGGMVTAFVKCRNDKLHPWLVEQLNGWTSSSGRYRSHINTPNRKRQSKERNRSVYGNSNSRSRERMRFTSRVSGAEQVDASEQQVQVQEQVQVNEQVHAQANEPVQEQVQVQERASSDGAGTSGARNDEERFPHITRFLRERQVTEPRRGDECCSICKESYYEMGLRNIYMFQPCFHTACKTCALQQYQINGTCPVCRVPMTPPRGAYF
jgi:hypothetical protein